MIGHFSQYRICHALEAPAGVMAKDGSDPASFTAGPLGRPRSFQNGISSSRSTSSGFSPSVAFGLGVCSEGEQIHEKGGMTMAAADLLDGMVIPPESKGLHK